MRSGLMGEVPDEPGIDIEAIQMLMLAFSREAMVVAGRCTVADRRNTVTALDMKQALMYCARTFFEHSDDELVRRINEARELMAGEDEDEDEDEEEEEEEEEEDEDEDETGCTETPVSPRDVALRRNVETIATHWHLWNPSDPMHLMIKRSIDNTPCSGSVSDT